MKRVLCLYRVSTKKQLDPSSDKTKGGHSSAAPRPARSSSMRIRIGCFARKCTNAAFPAIRYLPISGMRSWTSAPKRSRNPLTSCWCSSATAWGRREDETPFVVEWFVRNGIEVWSVNEGQLKAESHEEKLLNYIRFWQANGESTEDFDPCLGAATSRWSRGRHMAGRCGVRMDTGLSSKGESARKTGNCLILR